MRAKEAPALRPLTPLPSPSTNRRKIKSSPVDSTQGIHGRASAYLLFRGGIYRGGVNSVSAPSLHALGEGVVL